MPKTYTYYDPSATLEEFGIARPAGLDEANATANAVGRLAQTELDPVHPGNTTAETVQADIENHIRRRDLRDYARSIAGDFDRQARDLSREVYKADADRIITELQAATLPRLKVITDAAKILRPDDTAETVIERGSKVVEAWRNRDKIDAAHTELMQIAGTTEMIAVLARRMKNLVPDALWWVKVEDHYHLARIEANEWSDYSTRLLALIQGGHTVALATPEEATARAATVEHAREHELTKPLRDRIAAQNASDQKQADRLLAAHQRLVVTTE